VVVALVDEDDVDSCATQRPGCGEPAEAGADDDHAWPAATCRRGARHAEMIAGARTTTIATVLEAVDFARIAADRTRLAVLGCLALADATAAEVASAVGLSPREAVRVLGRLATRGLVLVDDGRYHLDDRSLRTLAESVSESRSADPAVLAGLNEDDAAVVARYFRGRRLIEIPAAESRRRAVLHRLLDEFEPGRYYLEADVRRILRRFHSDDAALRRHLVDDGLMARDPVTRTYWRGGGPPPAATP
jgi:hypothetical protein